MTQAAHHKVFCSVLLGQHPADAYLEGLYILLLAIFYGVFCIAFPWHLAKDPYQGSCRSTNDSPPRISEVNSEEWNGVSP